MTSRRMARTAALTAIVVLAMTLAACGKTPAVKDSASAAEGIAIGGDFSGAGPGTLRSATTLPTIDRRLVRVSSVAARITYDSTSGVDGSSQLVSGTVFAPVGPAPQGGWPIIGFAHGTTGVQHECAPSLSSNLLSAAEAVASLVKSGYIVVYPDYQGLGLDRSYHPYLDNATVGKNLIDGVRAARKVVPDASNRWLAFGSSQGGGAAWAANELSGTYGKGLELVGAAAVSPAADVAGLADLAASGTLTQQQAPILQWVYVALHNAHPDFNLDDYRRGLAAEKWDVLSACSGPLVEERVKLAPQIGPLDLQPATPAAFETLRRYLEQMAVPKTPTQAPMLVLYGGKDQLVAAAWTKRAVESACGMGDVIESYLLEDKGHDDIDGAVALEWIRNRFAGTPPLNMCGLPEPPSNGGESSDGGAAPATTDQIQVTETG